MFDSLRAQIKKFFALKTFSKYRTVDDLHTKFLKANIDKKVKEQNVLKLLEPSRSLYFGFTFYKNIILVAALQMTWA